MKKHYKIVSIPRFAAFIIFCTLVILVVIYMASGIYRASAGESSLKQMYPDRASYIEVTVAPGDTLWSIARDYYGTSIDKRQAIYEIQSINHLTNSYLYAGQIIRLADTI